MSRQPNFLENSESNYKDQTVTADEMIKLLNDGEKDFISISSQEKVTTENFLKILKEKKSAEERKAFILSEVYNLMNISGDPKGFVIRMVEKAAKEHVTELLPILFDGICHGNELRLYAPYPDEGPTLASFAYRLQKNEKVYFEWPQVVENLSEYINQYQHDVRSIAHAYDSVVALVPESSQLLFAQKIQPECVIKLLESTIDKDRGEDILGKLEKHNRRDLVLAIKESLLKRNIEHRCVFVMEHLLVAIESYRHDSAQLDNLKSLLSVIFKKYNDLFKNPNFFAFVFGSFSVNELKHFLKGEFDDSEKKVEGYLGVVWTARNFAKTLVCCFNQDSAKRFLDNVSHVFDARKLLCDHDQLIQFILNLNFLAELKFLFLKNLGFFDYCEKNIASPGVRSLVSTMQRIVPDPKLQEHCKKIMLRLSSVENTDRANGCVLGGAAFELNNPDIKKLDIGEKRLWVSKLLRDALLIPGVPGEAGNGTGLIHKSTIIAIQNLADPNIGNCPEAQLALVLITVANHNPAKSTWLNRFHDWDGLCVYESSKNNRRLMKALTVACKALCDDSSLTFQAPEWITDATIRKSFEFFMKELKGILNTVSKRQLKDIKTFLRSAEFCQLKKEDLDKYQQIVSKNKEVVDNSSDKLALGEKKSGSAEFGFPEKKNCSNEIGLGDKKQSLLDFDLDGEKSIAVVAVDEVPPHVLRENHGVIESVQVPTNGSSYPEAVRENQSEYDDQNAVSGVLIPPLGYHHQNHATLFSQSQRNRQVAMGVVSLSDDVINASVVVPKSMLCPNGAEKKTAEDNSESVAESHHKSSVGMLG